MSNWTEKKIAQALAEKHYKYRHLITVPNCHWAGHEADLLVVTKSLKLMDFEIKISKADFKEDRKKKKWWSDWGGGLEIGRMHPKNIWKHYFVMPDDIWSDDMIYDLPSQSCGVIVIGSSDGYVWLKEVVKAKANPDFKPLTNEQIIDIARLASIRMWSAIKKGI